MAGMQERGQLCKLTLLVSCLVILVNGNSEFSIERRVFFCAVQREWSDCLAPLLRTADYLFYYQNLRRPVRIDLNVASAAFCSRISAAVTSYCSVILSDQDAASGLDASGIFPESEY